jgi:hypothetical protein
VLVLAVGAAGVVVWWWCWLVVASGGAGCWLLAGDWWLVAGASTWHVHAHRASISHIPYRHTLFALE